MNNDSSIPRSRYTARVDSWVGKPVIKVLTGQRRVGKSFLLRAMAERLKSERPEVPLLLVDKERTAWSHVVTAADLEHEVQALAPEGPAVVMVDEVQEIADFEVALRSLLADRRFDLYVTGSNAELLSGEIASRLAGRAVSIDVHPLSYDEFLRFHGLEDADATLQLYLRYGGLPFLKHLELEDGVVFEYLHALAQTILLRDIVRRHRVRSPDLLERLVLFLADSVGSPVSAQSIVRYLKSQRSSASVPTVLTYLRHIHEACLVRRVRRADLVGKRLLEVADKHYFEDLGVRAALLGARPQDIGKLVENAVYNRLRVDGWTVTTGTLRDLEIDFVCERGADRRYVQACYLMADPTTRERELRSLLAVDDNFPKAIVSMDPVLASERGVHHFGLRAFLRDGWPP